MRLGAFILTCLFFGGAVLQSRPYPPDDIHDGATLFWKRMQQELLGTWIAKTGEGKTIKSAYKLVSNRSALVETYQTPSGQETLTVYHPDGSSLLLTHYCAQGNQPRLRIAETTPEKAVFKYLDATNLKAEQAVLIELAFNFERDGFEQVSIYRQPDGSKETTNLHFKRSPQTISSQSR
jgi:hypothetical protein